MIQTRHVALGLSLFVLACHDSPEPTSISDRPATSKAAPKQRAEQPVFWTKLEWLRHNGPLSGRARTSSVTVGANVDASNECGPQSETFIALNPNNPSQLTGGSNEIFRLPMRAYFSSDDGDTWGGVDVPLPVSFSGPHDQRFGSDPTLAYDTKGNVFYGFIVVVFSPAFTAVKGTELAVARSSDGGRTWPLVAEFSQSGGKNHFNDKPMITVDQNPGSPFVDNVYIAWDAAFGGSPGGGVRVGRSSDHGLSFAINRADSRRGPGRAIGADPFVGPDGALYVAWNDFAANTIAVNRSLDGGATWGTQRTIAAKSIPFAIALPAIEFRGALVYPACDADRSGGAHRGRLYCTWIDLNDAGHTEVLLSYSDNGGSSWSAPAPVGHQAAGTDRFNHWFSVDPVTGDVTVAYYDASGFVANYLMSRSTDGSATWLADVPVSSQSSNEHDCGGVFPCASIDYGNQYGDYEGLVSFNGRSHPIWTDSRRNTDRAGDPNCGFGLGLMEEVFTARVEN